MRRLRQVLIAGVVVTGAACAHRQPVAAAGSGPQTADSVVLNVTNHFSEQVVVFAPGPSREYRLGVVDPGSRGHFVMYQPWLYAGSVEFVARAQGAAGGLFRSGHLALMPGDVLDWDVQASLIHTRMTIRQ